MLQPLRELAQPLADQSQTLPYVTFQSLLDPRFPEGEMQYYWKPLDLDRLDDSTTPAICSG